MVNSGGNVPPGQFGANPGCQLLLSRRIGTGFLPWRHLVSLKLLKDLLPTVNGDGLGEVGIERFQVKATLGGLCVVALGAVFGKEHRRCR